MIRTIAFGLKSVVERISETSAPRAGVAGGCRPTVNTTHGARRQIYSATEPNISLERSFVRAQHDEINLLFFDLVCTESKSSPSAITNSTPPQCQGMSSARVRLWSKLLKSRKSVTGIVPQRIVESFELE